MFHIPVRNADREPICFVCEVPVDKAGTTCSRACYAHFLVAVKHQAGLGAGSGPIVSMEKLVDLWDMPWYGESNAPHRVERPQQKGQEPWSSESD